MKPLKSAVNRILKFLYPLKETIILFTTVSFLEIMHFEGRFLSLFFYRGMKSIVRLGESIELDTQQPECWPYVAV